MELITCRNGHRYDPSITPECPECARMGGGHTVPLDMGGFGPAEDIGKTMPISRGTVPVNPPASHYADPDFTRGSAGGAGRAEEYGATMPINYDRGGINEKAAQPVTGWLVCIEGPEKGKDYRLHEEYNYIGRSSHMDVSIPGDVTVSRENHAIIAYDTQERMFFFAPSSGASIVRHNGKAVLSNVELKYGDRLQIGKGIFLFVPLCGEMFQWEN